MKSQMSYKAKRNAIIVLIIAILVILASVGTYLFINGNDETQAMSQMNGEQNDRAGEDYQETEQVQNENNQNNNENEANNNASEENVENEVVVADNDNATENDNAETEVVNDNNDEVIVDNDNNNDDNEQNTYTQTITTTETVETTNTVVGFRASDVNARMEDINADLPEVDLTAPTATITYDVTEWTNGNVTATLTASEPVRLIDAGAWNPNEGYATEFKKVYPMNAEQTIRFVDEAGNEGSVELKIENIDKDVPEFVGLKNGMYYQDDITVNVEEENLERITAKVYANNYEIKELNNGDVLSDESIYYLTATDKAGNEKSIYVAVDKTNPVFTTLMNGHQYNKEVTIDVEDLKLKTIEVYSYEDKTTTTVENGAKLSKDGTYRITATDYSGRTTTICIEIDTKAPEIDYSTVRLDGEDYDEENGNKYYYVKNGDSFKFVIAFTEKLKQPPTVTIAGRNVDMTLNEKVEQEESKYLYEGTFTIPENEAELQEDILEIKVSNIVDLAGNVMEDTIQTPTTNHRVVVYDRTAPAYKAMGIFNWTNNKYGEDVRFAKENEHIRLFVAFPEMLAVNPKVDIYGENGTVTTMNLEYGEQAKFYFVEFDTTEELKLPQGKIQFKIYGYEDMAGNVGKELTQEDTTDTRFPEVIYDTEAPEAIEVKYSTTDPTNQSVTVTLKISEEVTFIHAGEWTKVEGEENTYQRTFDANREQTIRFEDAAGNQGSTFITINNIDKVKPTASFVKIQNSKDENTTWAKEGERVWVYVKIEEELSVKPIFKIKGIEVPIIQEVEVNNGIKYAALLEMTADIPEGNIEFEVSGFTDLAGNVGDPITITTDGSHITYDRSIPEFKASNFNIEVQADKNAEFTEFPEVSATDNFSKPENIKIELINNTVNMGKVGDYYLRYKTTDEAGNIATNKVFVKVIDTEIPKFKPGY